MKKLLLILALVLTTMIPSGFCVKAQSVPEAQSEYIYIEDYRTGQVLYEKNADARMYPASTTKMMTAILAIEKLTDLERKITITGQMLAGLIEADAAVAGFETGDQVTVKDLLYGILLASGADCVNALVYTISGSVDAFVELMNQKAAEIGMKDTHFTNPTGLHDADHYSTARDIAALLKYCRGSELFLTIIGTDFYRSSPVRSNIFGYPMRSWVREAMQRSGKVIPGYEGGKTGYTYPAGYCLASCASFNGLSLLSVICGYPYTMEAEDYYQELFTLYAYFFDHYEHTTLFRKGDLLGSIEVTDSAGEQSLALTADETLSLDLPVNSLRIVKDFPARVFAPLKQGDLLGTIRYYSGDDLLYEKEFFVENDIRRDFLAFILRKVSEFPGTGDSKQTRMFVLLTAGVVLILLFVLILSAVKKIKAKTK